MGWGEGGEEARSFEGDDVLERGWLEKGAGSQENRGLAFSLGVICSSL